MSDEPADASTNVAMRTRRVVAAKRVAKRASNDGLVAKQPRASNNEKDRASNDAAKQTRVSNDGLVARQPRASNNERDRVSNDPAKQPLASNNEKDRASNDAAKQTRVSNDGLVARQPRASNDERDRVSNGHPQSSSDPAKQTRTPNDGLVAADSLVRVARKMRSMPKRSARDTADDAARSLEHVTKQMRDMPKRSARDVADDAATSLERVATKIRAMPKRSARATADDAAASLARVTRKLRGPARTAKQRADDVYVVEREPFDLHLPARPVNIELVGGRAHYDRVIAAVLAAQTSVWIATANVKGMMVEGAARPGARRTRTSAPYVSVLSRLDELAARGVELRLLHAEIPSGPFREEIAAHPRLLAGGLELARCPRVHLKAVIVDGALLYLGSANWTGAGLGAKGSGKRNFELGVITDDSQLLDQVQALFERVWSGAECAGCKLRDVCPGPLDERAKRSRRVAGSSKRL